MPEDENFECEDCGKSFDSRRGLSIHETQAHSEENDTEETENNNQKVNSEENQGSKNISITTRQAFGVVLALGLAVGLSAGLLVSELTGQETSVVPSEDNEETANEQQVESGEPLEVMKEIANNMGMNGDQIASCVESSDGSEISEDQSEIESVVDSLGTPTFFIGNSEIGYTQITGAQPYSRMKSTIDEKISEANSGDTTVGDDEYTLDEIGFEGEPTLGDSLAPIKIIEYSDFGCPWCAEWHGVNAIDQRPIDEEDSFNQVRSNYVDTGDVQFVFKDYPVARLHPEAETAHKAANCVLENSQENYWEFSQNIFEERDRW